MSKLTFNITIMELAPGFVIYVLVGLGAIYAHDYSIYLYKTNIGTFKAKGMSTEIATYTAYYLVAFMNAFIYLIPKLKWKLLAVAASTLFIAWTLLPSHPIRAMAYGAFMMSTGTIAISARWAVERRLLQSTPKPDNH